MIELMDLQIHTITNAVGNSEIKNIYIDGGFTDNDVFMKLMSHHFQHYQCDVNPFSFGISFGRIDGNFQQKDR